MASTKLRSGDPVRKRPARRARTIRGVEFRCSTGHLVGIQTAPQTLEVKCHCREITVVELKEDEAT